MRKGIAFLFIIIFILLPPLSETATSAKTEMIPDEAIRLRILANSDNEEDQRIKLLVRDEVNNYINELVATIDNIKEARHTIREHVPEIESIVEETLKKEQVDPTYSVKYRPNVEFPTKIYGNYLYPAGEYEAVLITLGDGVGQNWWCVLFPPLCFLDFSEDEDQEDEADEAADQALRQQEEEEAEVEVRFFLFDWLGLS